MVKFFKFYVLPALLVIVIAAWAMYQYKGKPRRLVVAQNLRSDCLQFDPLLGHSYRPNCKGSGRRAEKLTEIRHNSMGLRGPEYSPIPAKGTYRILFLGSSDCYGLGQEEAETPPALLEAILRKKLRYPVEVINASAEGYTTLQHELWLPKLLSAYSPHLVIASIVPSDYAFRDQNLQRIARWSQDGKLLGFKWLPQELYPAWLVNALIHNEQDFRFWFTAIQQVGRVQTTLQFRMRRLLNIKNARRWLASPTVNSLVRIQRSLASTETKFLALRHVHIETNRQYVGLGLNENVLNFFSPLHRGIKFIPPPVAESGFDILGDALIAADPKKILFRMDPDLLIPGQEHLNQAGNILLAEDFAKMIEARLPAKKDLTNIR